MSGLNGPRTQLLFLFYLLQPGPAYSFVYCMKSCKFYSTSLESDWLQSVAVLDHCSVPLCSFLGWFFFPFSIPERFLWTMQQHGWWAAGFGTWEEWIIESQNHLSWKGPLKAICPTPCTEQGHPQLHQFSEPHPAWPWLSAGMGHHLLSVQPVLVPHSVIVKNLFLISNLNLCSFSLKPFPLVPSPSKESVPYFLPAPL